MKKFISSMLVVLLIFITPVSGISTSNQKENISTSNSSVWKNPVFLYAFQIFISPFIAGGSIWLICRGIDKARGLENNATLNAASRQWGDFLEKVSKLF